MDKRPNFDTAASFSRFHIGDADLLRRVNGPRLVRFFPHDFWIIGRSCYGQWVCCVKSQYPCPWAGNQCVTSADSTSVALADQRWKKTIEENHVVRRIVSPGLTSARIQSTDGGWWRRFTSLFAARTIPAARRSWLPLHTQWTSYIFPGDRHSSNYRGSHNKSTSNEHSK